MHLDISCLALCSPGAMLLASIHHHVCRVFRRGIFPSNCERAELSDKMKKVPAEPVAEGETAVKETFLTFEDVNTSASLKPGTTYVCFRLCACITLCSATVSCPKPNIDVTCTARGFGQVHCGMESNLLP